MVSLGQVQGDMSKNSAHVGALLLHMYVHYYHEVVASCGMLVEQSN